MRKKILCCTAPFPRNKFDEETISTKNFTTKNRFWVQQLWTDVYVEICWKCKHYLFFVLQIVEQISARFLHKKSIWFSSFFDTSENFNFSRISAFFKNISNYLAKFQQLLSTFLTYFYHLRKFHFQQRNNFFAGCQFIQFFFSQQISKCQISNRRAKEVFQNLTLCSSIQINQPFSGLLLVLAFDAFVIIFAVKRPYSQLYRWYPHCVRKNHGENFKKNVVNRKVSYVRLAQCISAFI